MSSNHTLAFERRCRRLGVFAAVVAGSILVLDPVMWFLPGLAADTARGWGGLSDDQTITLTAGVLWTSFALSLLCLVIPARGLLVVRGLCNRLAAGKVFEPETGLLLRRFGVTLLIYACVSPFFASAIGFLVTVHNPPGSRILTFALTGEEALNAVIGLLILLMGSILAEAARLAEENRQIV